MPPWQSLAKRLVGLRHPILLSVVVVCSWLSRSGLDWEVLTGASRAIFRPSALSLYATRDYLQAGPPSLVVLRPLAGLPGNWGEGLAHLLLAVLGWYLLWLVEHWCVPTARFFSIRPREGLLTLGVGLPALLIWTFLAGGAPHVEDGLTLLSFALAFRAISKGRTIWAAVLVGLTIAWKPWGVVALPMLFGLPKGERRYLLLALTIPAACWLPFVIGDSATLAAASHGFALQQNSPLRAVGMSGKYVPDWWRGLQLTASLAAACIAAFRRNWMVAFAAGCTVRLLLDPGGFDYYVSGLVMVTALTERFAGLQPWRTALLGLGLVYAQIFISGDSMSPVRFAVLLVVLVSWLGRWQLPAGSRDRVVTTFRPEAAAARAIPEPRQGRDKARRPTDRWHRNWLHRARDADLHPDLRLRSAQVLPQCGRSHLRLSQSDGMVGGLQSVSPTGSLTRPQGVDVLARIREAVDEREEGFTLIELLVVMIIIGILAAIAIPVFLNQRNSGYDASAKSDVKNAATAEETYFTDNQVYTSNPATPGTAGSSTGALTGWSKSANTSSVGFSATTSPDAYKVYATSKSGKIFCFGSASSGAGVTKVTATSAC